MPEQHPENAFEEYVQSLLPNEEDDAKNETEDDDENGFLSDAACGCFEKGSSVFLFGPEEKPVTAILCFIFSDEKERPFIAQVKILDPKTDTGFYATRRGSTPYKAVQAAIDAAIDDKFVHDTPAG